MTDTERHNQLATQVFAAMDMADWIYHDERLDIDGEASERTIERVKKMHEKFGKQGLFGLVGAWSIKTYWRVEDAFKRAGNTTKPSLIPGDMVENLPNEDIRKRSYVSAQQFIAAVARDDLEMGEAIFSAAYEAGSDDILGFVYCVLMLCIRTSNLAKNAP